MKTILAALFLALCQPAAAQTWLTASLASYHFERKDYCELNPGVGFEHAVGEGARGSFRLVAGSYQNSYCKGSAYLGGSSMPFSIGKLRAGAALVVITGYERDKASRKKDEPILAAVPTLAWEGARYGVNLVLLPPFDDFKGALGLQLKVKIQ